jgi:hypothetical protein
MAAVEKSTRAGVPLAGRAYRALPVVALGLSLSSFLAVSYVACVLGYILFPSLPIEHSALAIFLPGFSLLSWGTFFLGLVESVFWGWYVALIFGPLFNFFVARTGG